MEIKTTTLYIKRGRRYVPAYSEAGEWRNYDKDRMQVGTFRLTHAYCDGGMRYEHDVTPDTAGWTAAAMVALHAMAEKMHGASLYRASGVQHYTKKQLAALEEARKVMARAGLLLPTHWQQATPDQVARAGIEAVLQHARAPQTAINNKAKD